MVNISRVGDIEVQSTDNDSIDSCKSINDESNIRSINISERNGNLEGFIGYLTNNDICTINIGSIGINTETCSIVVIGSEPTAVQNTCDVVGSHAEVVDSLGHSCTVSGNGSLEYSLVRTSLYLT